MIYGRWDMADGRVAIVISQQPRISFDAHLFKLGFDEPELVILSAESGVAAVEVKHFEVSLNGVLQIFVISRGIELQCVGHLLLVCFKPIVDGLDVLGGIILLEHISWILSRREIAGAAGDSCSSEVGWKIIVA